MENNIVILDKFRIVYIDNYFVKLQFLDENLFNVEKKEIFPNEIVVGDKVQRCFNKATNSEYYEIYEKQVCLEEQISKKYVEKFLEKYKKENNICLSKWVVVGIENHSVCVAKIDDLKERKYEADIKFLLNARRGDLYYLLEMGKTSEYFYDEENNEDVCLEYAKLLRNELNENDLVVMRKMEKKNAKLFKKINPCIYQNSWCLEEMASESVFVGVGEKYDDMPIEKNLLPKQARLGDFVSLDKNNQYVFNRDALLKHIKNLEKLSKGVR